MPENSTSENTSIKVAPSAQERTLIAKKQAKPQKTVGNNRSSKNITTEVPGEERDAIGKMELKKITAEQF